MSVYANHPYIRYWTPSTLSYYPYAPSGAPLSTDAGSRDSTQEHPTSLVSDGMYFNPKKKLARSDKIRDYWRAQNSRSSTRELPTSQVSDKAYFSLNGKLASSDKIRDYGSQVSESDRMCFVLNRKLVRSCKIRDQVRDYREAQRHVLNLYPDALRGIASSRIQFYVMRPKYYREDIRSRPYISEHAWEAEIDNLAGLPLCIDVRESVSVTKSIFSFFNRARFKFF